MKKVLLVLVCVLTLVCLCACNADEYKNLNKLMSGNYSEIKITVETSKGDNDKLTSTVTVTNENGKSFVKYHIEKFAEITADQIPTDYKTIFGGEVEIENGVETGDVLDDISFVGVNSLPYHFAKDYFENATFKDGVFTANVTSAKLFTGNSSLSCSDMTVKFNYTASRKTLTINYVLSGGVEVQLTYNLR